MLPKSTCGWGQRGWTKSVIQDFMLETFAPPMYLHRVIHVNFSEYTAEWNISEKSLRYPRAA